jgi:2-polyprenyl-3-methyl-5-hydroxy-6-metoxy-1,4-benzoquinol methylase
MTHDRLYTLEDHEFRDKDSYALAKYNLTLRWIGRSGAGRTLLNLGCGSGVFNDMAAQVGFAVRGVEPELTAWELSHARAGGRYTVTNQSLFELGESDAADVVVMHDVLEHIDAEGSAVDVLARLIRPGGVAVVSVPALDSLFGYHDRQLGHYRRYTRTSLRRALQARLQVEKIRYFGLTGIPLVLWYSRIRDAPYPSAQNIGFISKLSSAACTLEGRVPFPVGTSVVAMVAIRK